MIAGFALEGFVLAAFLTFCRIGACFMLMPGLSSARVPMMIRLFVAVAVSFALLGHLWDQILPQAGDTRPGVLFPLVAREIIIGGLIGLVARFYTLALEFIGAAMTMTIGFGGMPGPSVEEEVPQSSLGSLISFSSLMILFVTDFHHQIIEAVVASYRLAPVGQELLPQSALTDLTDTLAQTFLLALQLGSPFIAYGILVNLAAGLINKLSPAIPVYFISTPFVLTGGLILLYFAIPTMLSLFASGFGTIVFQR